MLVLIKKNKNTKQKKKEQKKKQKKNMVIHNITPHYIGFSHTTKREK